ncbi:hypothetical protein Btru_035646 [Bulinus truncatus]|nr:hypothetical protein Btru_035646 [Bulinus truncatus]
MAEESSGSGYMPVPVIVEPAQDNDVKDLMAGACAVDGRMASVSGNSGLCELPDGLVVSQKVFSENDQSIRYCQGNDDQLDKKRGESDVDQERNEPEECGPDHALQQVEQQADVDQEEELLFPGFVPKTFYVLSQRNKLRFWKNLRTDCEMSRCQSDPYKTFSNTQLLHSFPCSSFLVVPFVPADLSDVTLYGTEER